MYKTKGLDEEYALELKRSIEVVKQEIVKLDMTNYNPGLVSAFLDRRGLLPHQTAREGSTGLDIFQERDANEEKRDQIEVKKRRERVMLARKRSSERFG